MTSEELETMTWPTRERIMALADLPAPLTGLAAMKEVRWSLEAWTGDVVLRARHAGHSWAEIADALGVSRQAVHHRYSVRCATVEIRD